MPGAGGRFENTCGSLPVAIDAPLIDVNPTPADAVVATEIDEVIGIVHASVVAPCAHVVTVTGVTVAVLPAVTGTDGKAPRRPQGVRFVRGARTGTPSGCRYRVKSR